MSSTSELQAAAPQSNSVLSPLRGPLFRAMFIAMTVSNFGTWMHDTGAAWLMTTLSDSKLMVALIQTATTLPFFFLAFPAGTLADIVDRRIYLLAMHAWMMAAALALTITTLAGAVDAWSLLALTFALGIGNAMMRPAWAAIIPGFVPKSELRNAVTLNSMSMNATRAIGPAIAGGIIVAAGPGFVFLLNSLSFFALVIVLLRWQGEPDRDIGALPVERFFQGMKAGLRYARHTPSLSAILIRGVGFFLFASASWALLPAIAVHLLGAGPSTYGLLMASIGLGAVVGALVLPRMHSFLSRDGIVCAGTLIFAATLVGVAQVRAIGPLAAIMALSGLGWIAVFSSLVVASQLAVPNWVRARGLSLVMLAFGGGAAAGSALWGQLSDLAGIPTALICAAAGLSVQLLLRHRFRIRDDDHVDLTPSLQWPTPEVVDDLNPDRGPVLVTSEYVVEPEQEAEFLKLIDQMRRIRQRDGAYFWEIFKDVANPRRYVEVFMVESWLEHLRQHQRVTVSDRPVNERLKAFHATERQPRVSHFIAGRPLGSR